MTLRSITVTSGFAAELPALQGRTFTLPDTGLTVLFGPNGSGKSTLLSLLAKYSGTEHGWTTFEMLSSGGADAEPYPQKLRARTNRRVRGCTADVIWDGSPTYATQGPSKLDQANFDRALEGSEDDFLDFFRRKMAPGSSGQEQILWLNKMDKVLAAAPDLLAENRTWTIYGPDGPSQSTRLQVNDVWRKEIDEFTEYVASLPRDGRPTLLLDEPDAHLSIPTQRSLWKKAFGRLTALSGGCQIIVATHSPFSLFVPSATVVDLKEGYVEECRKALLEIQDP